MKNTKVFVYFNLHKKVWSVRALEGPYKGLVIGHGQGITLWRVTPKVSAIGRDKVRTTGVKNVHAGLVGELLVVDDTFQWHKGRKVYTIGGPITPKNTLPQITYNPYKYQGFVYRHNEKPFESAKLVEFKVGIVTTSEE